MCQTDVEGLICFATGGVCVLLGIVVDGGRGGTAEHQ